MAAIILSIISYKIDIVFLKANENIPWMKSGIKIVF